MAEWEREEISNRVSSSIPIRAKLGKPLGGQAIFGYSWRNKEYVINESEAPIRKLICEIFLRTRRKKTTADELNKLGYRTRKGALFSDTTVTRLLRDTTAKGERMANYTKTGEEGKRTVLKQKSEWVITKCPRIISEQMWNKVNYILDEQESRSSYAGRKSRYLLSGFVKCSCLKKMYVKRTKIYQCKDCRVKIAISDIEGMFWGFLSDCLSNIELSKINENSNSLLGKKQTLLEETKSEKAALETKINRCMEMRMDGEITKENFTANFYLLKTQLANLEELLKNLRSEMDSEMHQIALGKDLFNEIQLLVYNWPNMAFARKRSIIETVTKEILVSKNDISIEFSINLQKLLGDRKFPHNSPLVLPSLLFKLEFRKPIHQNYPQNPTTIGEHLRKKRIDSDLSQAELAKILGVSTDCLTYWENNRSSPQITYYPRIHHFLGFYTTTFNETTFAIC